MIAAALLSPAVLHAQAKALPVDTPYEKLPVLDAMVILRPEYSQGPNFTVRNAVTPVSGSNHYIIDSDWGTFAAEGNAMLMRRISEINAMAKLQEMSQSQEFQDGLKNAAKMPLNVAENLIDDPIETLAAVPKGIGGFLKRTGQSIKETAQGRKRGAGEGGAVENISGFTKSKRELALKLGVDPYSRNKVFQDELNRVAWPAFAGKFAVGLGFSAIGGAVSVVNTSGNLTEALRDKSPVELRSMNQKILTRQMGINERVADAFLNNSHITPTTQVTLVAALQQLGDVPGQGEFIKAATSADDEGDGVAYQQSAEIMAQLNGVSPVARITQVRGLPVCILKDGTVVVALQWDYVAWTALAEKFVTALKAEKFPTPPTGYALVFTGEISPRAAQELASRGVKVTAKALPGPLK